MYKGQGWDKHRVRDLTKIDDWFLSRLDNIAATGKDTDTWAALTPLIQSHDEKATSLLREIKQLGFTDEQIANFCGGLSDDDVRACRKALGVIPRVKQIDTLAAEYAAHAAAFGAVHAPLASFASSASHFVASKPLALSPEQVCTVPSTWSTVHAALDRAKQLCSSGVADAGSAALVDSSAAQSLPLPDASAIYRPRQIAPRNSA